MLDGAARLGELFDETERLGMPALATTDHGYLFGAFDFWKRATDKGIKPIIGVEAYVTPGNRPRRTRPACAGARKTSARTTSPAAAPTRT